jgi:LPS export ABC transporter permease LptG
VSIIDRYIVKEFLKAFTIIIVSFVVLFLIFDFSINAGRFFQAGIASRDIVSYYLWLAPSLLGDALPMVLLLALFWSMNRLNKNHEIAALQASGISVLRICVPLFIVGLVLALLNYQINEDINTRNAVRIRHFVDRIRGEKTTEVVKEQHFITDINSSLLWFAVFDPETRRMSGGIFWDNFGPYDDLRMSIIADSGEYIGGSWWLYDLKITYVSDGAKITVPKMYKRRQMYEWDFRPSELTATRDFSEMRITSLRKGARKYRERQPEMARDMQIEFHNRFAMPLMNLTSLLLALPFAFRVRATRSVLAGIGISFLLVFAYYGVYTLAVIIARQDILVPYIIWAPNILFGTLGIILFRLHR